MKIFAVNQNINKMTKNEMERKTSIDDVHSQFTHGVPLSARTIQRRTGIKNKAVLGITKTLISKGKLRRVHPSEVGYNKFEFPSEEQVRLIEKGKRRKNGNEKPKKGEKTKKEGKDKNKGKFKGGKLGKYPPVRRFHVFMLV